MHTWRFLEMLVAAEPSIFFLEREFVVTFVGASLSVSKK
jgi:hypothetical protein